MTDDYCERIRAIEITFPVPVHVGNDLQNQLDSLVGEICRQYEARHPDRAMWPFGFGFKITDMPMTREEEQERGIQFDERVLHIEVAERENYGHSAPQSAEAEPPTEAGA